MNTRPTRMAPPPQQQIITQGDNFANIAGKLPSTTANGAAMTEVKQVTAAPTAYPPTLAKAIMAVTGKINPIAKAGWNDFHKYAYRRFEDVFEELVPLLVEHGILIEQTELNRGGLESDLIFITYAFTIVDTDGHVWPTRPEITAICKIRDSKGVLDDKAASKCNTQAQKYFYTSFFKIRSVDTREADADAGGRPSSQPRRAPAPGGKVQPREIAIVNGEAPEKWGERFKKAILACETEADVNAWYDVNAAVFDKLKRADGNTYELMIEVMDQQVAKLNAPKFDLEEWVTSLENAYSGCEDAMQIGDAQAKYMLPMKGQAGETGWKRAMEVTQKHLDRVQQVIG